LFRNALQHTVKNALTENFNVTVTDMAPGDRQQMVHIRHGTRRQTANGTHQTWHQATDSKWYTPDMHSHTSPILPPLPSYA